ncbi:MAG: RHS repeat protein, partial [Chlorobi bacterium]|nr:RHS repeat protein [Chlorobiota bacterium]
WQTTDYNGEGSEMSINTYTTAGAWCPSKVETSIVTKTLPGESSFSRSTNYTYTPEGLVSSIITDTGASKSVTTAFQYDAYGNITKKTVSASGLDARTEQYEYDSKGRFVTKQINPLGHYITRTYDPVNGNVTEETDINGLVTSYSYDGFGNLTSTTTPRGHTITTKTGWKILFAPDHAVYYVENIVPGKPDIKTWYDVLGRELKTELDGTFGTIITEKEYKPDRNVLRESKPYYSGETPKWTEYAYDDYGRKVSETFLSLSTSYDLMLMMAERLRLPIRTDIHLQKPSTPWGMWLRLPTMAGQLAIPIIVTASLKVYPRSAVR